MRLTNLVKMANMSSKKLIMIRLPSEFLHCKKNVTMPDFIHTPFRKVFKKIKKF
jgi:hypothetical protein